MDFKELWTHISTFDDPVKSELTNSLKYAAAALPVAIIGSETIRRTMDDDKEAIFIEDSFANLTNILIRLVAVIVIFFAANRFATYFVPDGDYKVVAHMVVFLVASNSTIGSEVRELVRRYMDTDQVAVAHKEVVQTMTGPTQFLPPPAIREPTTSTGADIRPPPGGGGISVGPGTQPNFNDMY
jgi:hypothetical protein